MGTPYDNVAEGYDETLARDAWMRRALFRHFARLFRSGDHVLDIGAGTGIDALYLASSGIRVTAVDASIGMLDQLREKLARTPLSSRVDVQLGEAVEVARRLPGPFDGIISSFAAMNTVDMTSFAPEAARLLRPGGRFVAHLLSPAYGAGGLARRAWRALSHSPYDDTILVEIGGRSIPHLVLDQDDFYHRALSAHFMMRDAYALGFLVGRRAERHLPARVLDGLARLEARVTRPRRLTSAGRFYVLDLERRGYG
jgi:SAM-dependent methyltransferase